MTLSELTQRPTPQIAAIDMDDTLLRTDKSISPATLDALLAWLDAGRRLVIATGRPPRRIVDSLPPALQHVPWVAYNGAIAGENGAVVLEDYLAVAHTHTVLDLLFETIPGLVLGLEIDDVIYFNQPLENIVGEVVEDLKTIATRPAAKILFRLDDFAPMRAVEPRLPAGTRIILSEKYHLVQIMSASADKATALAHLATRWGLDMSHMVAFGDDTNDVGMVAEAGLGVAVENAVAEVLAVADYVTHSNNDDGVAAVLQTLLAA
ncbi:MAG: HAD family hydrolase [Litorilinea sp.]